MGIVPLSNILCMIGSMIACMLTAVGVSLVFSYIGVDGLAMGIGVGLILGLLIIFSAGLSDYLFCGWGFNCSFFNRATGYQVCC